MQLVYIRMQLDLSIIQFLLLGQIHMHIDKATLRMNFGLKNF